MTYAEGISFLYGLRTFGAKFGLENTRKLASIAGNPQEKLRFIHVAGTNGKGSTCAMLESIYRHGGYKVGLYTSPHLVHFGERIQINRVPISRAQVVNLIEWLLPALKSFPKNGHPTFFEVVTVMALKHFAYWGCDIVIWETGLGGRLDSTNIVLPLASVITNIQRDHEKWLGETLEQIAFEKAGIIKSRVPVITAVTSPEAFEVIQRVAGVYGAPLRQVTKPLGVPQVSLIGDHQRLNAALAVAVVEELRATLPVDKDVVRAGLESVSWPGRFQIIDRGSGRKVVLDGAHNPDGARALVAAFNQTFGGAKASLILGILEDKKFSQVCEALAPLANRIFLVPVQSDRTAQPTALLESCRKANPAAEVVRCDSLTDALEQTQLDQLVLISGSLYLVGEALELLQPDSKQQSERGLNEWNANAPR
jgi:dihydrofolate synthase/folylpolyglutamate synthase